ncbi:MAG: hypothetical protein ABGZ53_15725 [Fuerstiella sp.]
MDDAFKHVQDGVDWPEDIGHAAVWDSLDDVPGDPLALILFNPAPDFLAG